MTRRTRLPAPANSRQTPPYKLRRALTLPSTRSAKGRRRASALKTSELLDRDTVEAVARLFIEKYAKANTRPRSWIETARLIGLKPDPADPSKLVLTENKTLAGGQVLGRWHTRTIHEITRRDVHELLDRVIARGAPGAANRVLAAVRKMFAWAASRDIIAVSPCAGIRPPTRENSRDRVLSDDDVVLGAAPMRSAGRSAPWFNYSHWTLQRRNEVAEINRSELRPQDDLWVCIQRACEEWSGA